MFCSGSPNAPNAVMRCSTAAPPNISRRSFNPLSCSSRVSIALSISLERTQIVIAGLDPAIHPFRKKSLTKMDHPKSGLPDFGHLSACVVKPAGDGRFERRRWRTCRGGGAWRVEDTKVGLRRRAAAMLGFARKSIRRLRVRPKIRLTAGETRYEVRHLRLHRCPRRDAAEDLRGSVRLTAGGRGRRLLRLSSHRASRDAPIDDAVAERVSG